MVGGLVGRAVIENCSEHNIENFISLSSPQMGQYGGKTERKRKGGKGEGREGGIF